MLVHSTAGAVIDRQPSINALTHALEVATSNAAAAGCDPAAIILAVLRMADSLAIRAHEQGVDLSALEAVE
jgi:hypothetical protein